MISGGFKFQRRIGLWVLMIGAGLGSYGLGLYQGSAFRMQRIAATEGRKEAVRVLASPAIPEVVPIPAPAVQPLKAVAPAPSPKPKAKKVQAPKAAPAVVPAAATAAAATVSPQPEPSLQPSSTLDSPDNIQSPM